MSRLQRQLPVPPRTGDAQTKAWFSAATEIINGLLSRSSTTTSSGNGSASSSSVSKSALGLDQVDNTRDMDKPLSKPQSDALDNLRQSAVLVVEQDFSGNQQARARDNIGILDPSELITFDDLLVTATIEVVQIGKMVTLAGTLENVDAAIITAGTVIGTVDASLYPVVDFMADGLSSLISITATGDIQAARNIAIGGVIAGSLVWLTA